MRELYHTKSRMDESENVSYDEMKKYERNTCGVEDEMCEMQRGVDLVDEVRSQFSSGEIMRVAAG